MAIHNSIFVNQITAVNAKDISMTTMMNSAANGRKRASLNDQINRLDSVLDGLADGLNGAVADAVKDAVGQAVREAVQVVLTDVLTSPQIIAKLHSAMATSHESTIPPMQADPLPMRQSLDGLFARVRARLADLRTACGKRAVKTRILLRDCLQATSRRLAFLRERCHRLRPFRKHLLVAAGIGTLMGGIVWLSGPWLGVVMSAVGSFATTLAVQAGLWLRKIFATEIAQVA